MTSVEMCKMRGSERSCRHLSIPHRPGESYHATVAAFSLHSSPTTARGGLTITTSRLSRGAATLRGRSLRSASAITRWWKRSPDGSLAGALALMGHQPIATQVRGRRVSGGSTGRDLTGSVIPSSLGL